MTSRSFDNRGAKWRFGDGRPVNDDGVEGQWITPENASAPLFEIYPVTGHLDEIERGYRLIAAAPEMAELLEASARTLAKEIGVPFEVVDALPPSPGMSLRDWFAGQALAGLAQTYAADPPRFLGFIEHKNMVAEYAYGCADAMLEARQANPDNGSSLQTGEQSDG